MTKKEIYALQGVLSAATATISAKLGILYPMLLVFLAVMVVDFVSGMAASAKEAVEHPEDNTKGWNSRKGMLGIFKKAAYVFVVGVAIGVDYVILKAGEYFGFETPVKTFFGLLVTIWFILNEFLSILENAGRMGASDLIPNFLLKIIATLKDRVSEKGDGGNGND